MKQTKLPDYVAKYFWGDDLSQLSLQENQQYIIQTLLEQGNSRSVKWLFSVYSHETIRNSLNKLRLSKKSSNFWRLYLSQS